MRPRTPCSSLPLASLLACSLLTSACGQMTIRTWVKVVEEQSSGTVVFLGNELPLERVQGGFFSVVRLDTRNLLAPLRGTIRLDDVRIATFEPLGLREICTWGNPAVASTGTVVLDIIGGGPSQAQLTINLRATTRLSTQLQLPPAELSQPATFDLGSGVTLDRLLAAQAEGSADGLFATQTSFVGDSEVGGLPVQFRLDIQVTNEGSPPLFDADLLAFCGAYFEEQGRDLFWSVNSKGSYRLADVTDATKPPLVIELADVGAVPGDVLRLRRVGTFSATTTLRDGQLTGLTAVFSGSDRVLGETQRQRVPDAIDAGEDVVTGSVIACSLIVVCLPTSTDIPEDFRVDPTVDVAVPSGATHLVVAGLPPGPLYRDNSGFGFGVAVEVLP